MQRKIIVVLIAINIVLAIMLLAGCSKAGMDPASDRTAATNLGEVMAA